MPGTLFVTGHRPNRLGGYAPDLHDRLVRLVLPTLAVMAPRSVLIGMALGFDQACAEACTVLGVEWHAVLPGKPHPGWPVAARARYDRLLSAAASVETIWEGPLARNVRMVERAAASSDGWGLGLWDGSNSGTGHAVRAAWRAGLPVWNLWEEWRRRDG